MTETLYIRLASQAQDVVHWLIYCAETQEIIASGELKNAAELSQLTEKAQTRTVVCFLPSSDVLLKSLTVPGNSQRAIRMATPYILEDDLAQEVEQLFFAYATIKNTLQEHNCFVAIVDRNQLALWQLWLADADITCKTMIPEVLALPDHSPNWSAITLGQQLILRQGVWQGISVDVPLWPQLEKSLAEQLQTQPQNNEQPLLPVIYNYSTITTHYFDLKPQPEELPLALLAKHASAQKFNLLQGEFQVKQTRSPIIKTWLSVAVIASIALLFTLAVKIIKLQQLNNEIDQLENQIVSLYKTTFPETKRVNVATVSSQLKRKLAELGNNTSGQNFLIMLEKLKPAFTAVPTLKPESIKFDSRRNELRIQATANNYQAFELFKKELEKANFVVSQGALNNQGELVSGSFSIKDK
jgi:general secretion pathway protein L